MLNDVVPPFRCDDHADSDEAPYCGDCMSQQKIHAKWLKARQADEAQQERDRKLQQQQSLATEENRVAIALCVLCDERGYAKGENGVAAGAFVCDHVDRRETARRGSALVRAELARLAEARKANR